MIQEKLMPDSCSWHEKTPIYDISSKIPAGFRLCEKETPVPYATGPNRSPGPHVFQAEKSLKPDQLFCRIKKFSKMAQIRLILSTWGFSGMGNTNPKEFFNFDLLGDLYRKE